MASKFIFELKRKFIHVFALLYIAIYYIFSIRYGHNWGIIALVAVLYFFLILEFFRLELKKKIPIFHIFWREKEKNKLGGQIYFVLGAIIVFTFFDFRIAVAVILMTIFGDIAAALFGIRFGKRWLKKTPDRAWEGIIAVFVVDLILVFFLVDGLVIVVLMALIATFVETKVRWINDNLAIPVSAGFVGQILKILVG